MASNAAPHGHIAAVHVHVKPNTTPDPQQESGYNGTNQDQMVLSYRNNRNPHSDSCRGQEPLNDSSNDAELKDRFFASQGNASIQQTHVEMQKQDIPKHGKLPKHTYSLSY